jgi:hypothetical protein
VRNSRPRGHIFLSFWIKLHGPVLWLVRIIRKIGRGETRLPPRARRYGSLQRVFRCTRREGSEGQHSPRSQDRTTGADRRVGTAPKTRSQNRIGGTKTPPTWVPSWEWFCDSEYSWLLVSVGEANSMRDWERGGWSCVPVRYPRSRSSRTCPIRVDCGTGTLRDRSDHLSAAKTTSNRSGYWPPRPRP